MDQKSKFLHLCRIEKKIHFKIVKTQMVFLVQTQKYRLRKIKCLCFFLLLFLFLADGIQLNPINFITLELFFLCYILHRLRYCLHPCEPYLLLLQFIKKPNLVVCFHLPNGLLSVFLSFPLSSLLSFSFTQHLESTF